MASLENGLACLITLLGRSGLVLGLCATRIQAENVINHVYFRSATNLTPREQDMHKLNRPCAHSPYELSRSLAHHAAQRVNFCPPGMKSHNECCRLIASMTRRSIGTCFASIALLCSACNSHRQQAIAVVPQTESVMPWEVAHAGVEAAAASTGVSVHWSAPPREDDVEAQVALVDRIVASRQYQGLVLAPDQALALISPVQRALNHDIATVVIGSPLPVPGGNRLSYVINDDEEGGRLAAERAARILHGHGTVAVLGINPDITGIMVRARAFERVLSQIAPGIHIVEKRMGSFNVSHEQQVAEEVLRANPSLDAIVALMWTTINGSLSALDSTRPKSLVHVIGFDIADLPPFDEQQSLDSIVQADTRSMGYDAVELLHARALGKPVPALVRIHPTLITRENIDSPEVHQMLSQDWKARSREWNLEQ